MSSVAVVGAGTAGCAAALLLAEAGHDVVVFEQAQEPGPAGAGILLQPSGRAVLRRLGLDREVAADAAPIRRLRCRTAAGRVLLDLAYEGEHGLGVHRGTLFRALYAPLEHAGVEVRTGTRVERLEALERFDLVVAADGARSELRAAYGPPARVRPYPWGALWLVGDRGDAVPDALDQVVDGTRFLAGLLPTGRTGASVFYSVPAGRRPPDLAERLAAHHPAAAQLVNSNALQEARYLDVALERFSARRRAELRFYGFASRWMTPFFQSGRDRLAPPRDLLLGPLSRLPWVSRQMVSVMAGTWRLR